MIDRDALVFRQDVYPYLVLRKEFLNRLGHLNGLVIDTHLAYQSYAKKLLARAKALEDEGDKEGPSGVVSIEVIRSAYQHLIAPVVEERDYLGMIANHCVVTIYQYWEERVRPGIAAAFGVQKNEIAHAVFGELRHIRMAIIHNGEVATNEVASNQILTWFGKGQLIRISWDQYFDLEHKLSRVLLDHDLIPEGRRELAEQLRGIPDL